MIKEIVITDRTKGEWKVHIPEYSTRFFITDLSHFLIAELERNNKPLEETRANAAFIVKSVNNFDSMMDALSQCHNLFESEYQDLSDQGKRVRQSVIAAILKATHKPPLAHLHIKGGTSAANSQDFMK